MASRWTRDIITVWENASLGTYNTTFFEGSRASVPATGGPFGLVTASGGTKPEFVQNNSVPVWRFPSAQITVYSVGYIAAYDFASSLWNALAVVINAMINSTKYKKIDAIGDLRDMGVDSLGRSMIVFNIVGEKGPSH